MENASKALIIAGAILLSILIITLGIMIFRQAAGVVNNNSMDEVEIATFNQKFLQYEGSNVRGANVNALINSIISNNISNSDDTSRQIKLKVTSQYWQSTKPTDSTAPTSKTETGSAQTGKTYEVNMVYDNNTGLITSVEIKDPDSKTQSQ